MKQEKAIVFGDRELELYLREERRKEVQAAYPVLNEMMRTFREWFLFDEDYDEDDKQIAENAFARTKLCLELGEYTKDDLEYLFWLSDKCADREEYHKAVTVFIGALADEYGWV